MLDEVKSTFRIARPLQVLILEDEPADAELAAAALRRPGITLTSDLVDSPGRLRERLGAADYDIILADYNLGDWTAMDALEILHEAGKDIPLIVVTGTLGDEEAVECIKRGAADYVLKDHLHRLPVAVESALRRKADRDEVARQQEQVRRSKEEWEMTFDTVPDTILLLDEDFRIKLANRATSVLLGREPVELLGKHCYEVVHGCAEPHADCPYRRLIASGKEQRSDIVETRLGKTFEATASPFFDSGGTMCGCVHVLRDITERKRTEESLRQLSSQLLHAQDEERRHIARELHDSTAQNLAALNLNLGWIEESTGSLDAQSQAILTESLDLVNRCTQEIRVFSYLLHPPTLDEYGLCSALGWFAEGFERRTGIKVALELPDNLSRLPRNVEMALFRLAQECLTNVHRHSGSSTVSIRMAKESNRLCLEVADQGCGMPPSALGSDAAPLGVGVLGMRERMREQGGTLEIQSDTRGTTVRASLPLMEAAA